MIESSREILSMHRYLSKFNARRVGNILIAVLLPVCAFSQSKEPRQRWSYDYIEKASGIPAVRQLMIDSIQSRLAMIMPGSNMASMKDTALLKRLTQIKGVSQALRNFSGAGNDPSLFLTNLPAFYSLKQISPANLKQGIAISVDEVVARTVYDNGPLTANTLISQAGTGLHASLWNVPFNYTMSWQYPAFLQEDLQLMNKLSFDRDAMMNNLKKQLTDQFNLDKLLLKDMNFQQLFRQYAQTKLDGLKNELSSAGSSFRSLPAQLAALSPDEFLYLNEQQLAAKLFNKATVDSLQAGKQAYESIVTNGRQLSEADQSSLQSIQKQLTDMETAMNKVKSIKKEFGADGLDYKKLVTYQQAITGNANAILNSNDFISEASGKLLKLNGLSRFFLHVKELNIGQFASTWSNRSLSGIMSSGIGGDYMKKNKLVGLNLSHSLPLGWIKDNPFASNLFDPSVSIQAVRTGKGETTGDHSHVSAVNATTRNKPSQTGYFPVLPRNIFVGSFSKQVSLGAKGNATVEVSKSASQYRTTMNAGNEVESKLALRHIGEDLLQTIAVGVQYNGEFSKINFRPSVFINYAGMGYSNPASTAQTRGNLSFGGSLYKTFMKGKLVMQSRFSKRNTSTSAGNDTHLDQLQSSLMAKYRVSRKLRIGVNWTSSHLSKKYGKSDSEKLYALDRMGADVSFNGKLNGAPFFQYTGIGYQNINMPAGFLNSMGKMIWVNSSSSVSLGKGMLSVNLQWYNQLQTSLMQGDLFTGDAGFSFTLGKKIQLSMAANYLDQQYMARQLGIRQTITTTISKHFNVNVFADIRKNMIDNMNPFLFPSTRGEIEITYKFR
jgi:hypothetical protein